MRFIGKLMQTGSQSDDPPTRNLLSGLEFNIMSKISVHPEEQKLTSRNSASDTTAQHPIIFYDGDCGFCNASVHYIIGRDPDGHFHFAAQQSGFAASKFTEHAIEIEKINSLVLLEADRVYLRGKAVLKIARKLKGFPGFMGTIFSWLPWWLIDPPYRVLALVRRRIPAPATACMLPTPEIQKRFKDK